MNKRIKKKMFKFADIHGYEMMTDPQMAVIKASGIIHTVYVKGKKESDIPIYLQVSNAVEELVVDVFGQAALQAMILGADSKK